MNFSQNFKEMSISLLCGKPKGQECHSRELTDSTQSESGQWELDSRIAEAIYANTSFAENLCCCSISKCHSLLILICRSTQQQGNGFGIWTYVGIFLFLFLLLSLSPLSHLPPLSLSLSPSFPHVPLFLFSGI